MSDAAGKRCDAPERFSEASLTPDRIFRTKNKITVLVHLRAVTSSMAGMVPGAGT